MTPKSSKNEEIARMYAQGKSLDEIGAVYHISRQRVYQLLHYSDINIKTETKNKLRLLAEANGLTMSAQLDLLVERAYSEFLATG